MQSFVAAVFPEHVLVTNPAPAMVEAFRPEALGSSASEVHLAYAGQQELAGVLTRLQQLGVPFLAAGPGWHPAAIFSQLKDTGLVSGSIRTIVWVGPGVAQLGEA